jgi:hypothetical protein
LIFESEQLIFDEAGGCKSRRWGSANAIDGFCEAMMPGGKNNYGEE